MSWVLAMTAGWLVIGIALAILIGRSVRRADVEAAKAVESPPNFVVDEPTAKEPAERPRHTVPGARRPQSRLHGPSVEPASPGQRSARG